MTLEKHSVQQSGLPEHNVQYCHKERDAPDCGTHHVLNCIPDVAQTLSLFF